MQTAPDITSPNPPPPDVDPRDPKGLVAVRDYLAQLQAAGRHDEVLDQTTHLLHTLASANSDLTHQLEALRKILYGRRSEKLDPAQLTLFTQLFGEESTPLEPTKPEASDDGKSARAPQRRPGRNPLPEHLPRKRIELKVADEQRTCPICGTEKVCIGHEVSEVLNFVPASFEVLEYAREKLACKPCQEGVVIAPAASKIIDGGKCGPGLLAQVLVSKYADHCPLYRQHQIYLRAGVDLSENTLGSWVARAAVLLSPVARGIWERLAAATVLGGDDTGLRVLDADHENGSKRGHMWGYVAYDEGKPALAGFRYTTDWKKTGPGEFLTGFAGTLQCDGYAGWASLAKDELKGMTLAGCWAHSRRKLVEALEAKALSAAVALKLIQKLYAVEAEAREHDAATRLVLRQRDAVPVMADIKTWLGKHYGVTRPSSPLGKAVEYMHNQWDALQVYLGDGGVCIDNNWVENHLRPICVGKKNYLFAGSDEGAERAAVIYTVLANCKLAGVEPWAYLNAVLPELAQLRVGLKPEDVVPVELASHLVPQQWLAARRVVATDAA